MKKIFVLFLFVFAFSACAHSAGTTTITVTAWTNPDPVCPDGYTWTVQPDDADHGACLRVGMTLTANCQSYRDTEFTPAYAFWACNSSESLALMSSPYESDKPLTLMPNPFPYSSEEEDEE